jgi:hypothetical protein
MIRYVLLTAAILLGAPPTMAQRPTPVDLELAFVVDASGSIDEAEMDLQRRGYADALVHPRVLQAISSGFLRSIAVSYIEFAGDGCTRMGVGWTRIADRASATEFGNRVLKLDRNFCFGGNAISEALAFAAASIDANEFEGTRRVIDISGDGPNTMGEPVDMVRDAIVRRRIVINALAIKRETMPDLPEYFRTLVIGGPGSFMIKADREKDFAQAILRKMIREIAELPP